MMSKIQQALQKKLQAAQARLRDGKIGVSLVNRGHRLYLRGTFPPSLAQEGKIGISNTLAWASMLTLKESRLLRQKPRK